MFLLSCEKDPVPTADFIYEQLGRTITFTNASLDATSYEWDFVDSMHFTLTAPAPYGTSTRSYSQNGAADWLMHLIGGVTDTSISSATITFQS